MAFPRPSDCGGVLTDCLPGCDPKQEEVWHARRHLPGAGAVCCVIHHRNVWAYTQIGCPAWPEQLCPHHRDEEEK